MKLLHKDINSIGNCHFDEEYLSVRLREQTQKRYTIEDIYLFREKLQKGDSSLTVDRFDAESFLTKIPLQESSDMSVKSLY